MLGPAISVCLSCGVAGFVGVRLLRLAQRTRRIPELAIGIGFLCYATAQIGMLLSGITGGASGAGPAVFTIMRFGGFTGVQIAISTATIVIFGRTLLRILLCVGLVGGGLFARVIVFDALMRNGSTIPVAQGLSAVTFALTFIWMGVEALRCLGKAQRAFEIGVVRPDVPNRLLVWGLGFTASGLIVLAVAACNTFGLESVSDGPKPVLITLAGFVQALTWVLALTPPAAYRRYVASRAPAEEALV